MSISYLLDQLNTKLSTGFICITIDACRDNPRNTTFASSGITATRSSKVKRYVAQCATVRLFTCFDRYGVVAYRRRGSCWRIDRRLCSPCVGVHLGAETCGTW